MMHLRFFVAYDGEYLVQGTLQDFTEKTVNAVPGTPEAQCVSFSCTIPASNGRGFIEVMVIFLIRPCMLVHVFFYLLLELF